MYVMLSARGALRVFWKDANLSLLGSCTALFFLAARLRVDANMLLNRNKLVTCVVALCGVHRVYVLLLQRGPRVSKNNVWHVSLRWLFWACVRAWTLILKKSRYNTEPVLEGNNEHPLSIFLENVGVLQYALG